MRLGYLTRRIRDLGCLIPNNRFMLKVALRHLTKLEFLCRQITVALKKYPTLHLQVTTYIGQYRLFPVTKLNNNNNLIWHLQEGNAFPFQS